MAVIALLWADETGLDLDSIRAAAAQHGASATGVSRRALPTAIMAALARGGVVYLASTDEDATEALGLGVDEVLRGGRATPASIKRAIDRARARADARARREQISSRDYVGVTLSLIAGAVGHELNNPLAVATLNCHSVHAGLAGLLRVHEKLAEWAMLSMPASEVARMSAAIANAPSPSELRAMLVDADAALARASSIMGVLRRLSTEDETFGRVRVRPAFDDFCSLFRPELDAIAATHVDVGHDCEIAISRPAFVSLLTILFAYVYECVRAQPGAKKAELDLSEHDDIALLEVRYGGSSPADLRYPDLGSFGSFGARRTPAGGLALLRDRASQLGGELLSHLDDDGSTTVRLILPLASVTDAPAIGENVAPRRARAYD